MRGAILYGPRDVRFEERPSPRIVKTHGRDHQGLGYLRAPRQIFSARSVYPQKRLDAAELTAGRAT